MDNPAAPAESLNVEQLLHLHTLTKDVAKLCQKQLRGHLDTLALLFRPRRILGDAMEGAERETVGGSDRTLTELKTAGLHQSNSYHFALLELPPPPDARQKRQAELISQYGIQPIWFARGDFPAIERILTFLADAHSLKPT